MITDIQELNFPEYATLSTATATLVDMGDKTITAQVKIDGSIAPDFSYDWEIIFQGERYIHPLREPQASKGNESISSVIDLTFYHKGIYDLKRYFFVDLATTASGTAMVDKYIVPLSLNIEEFVTALNNVLAYYYGDTYKVELNPDFEFDATDKKLVDINYTHIWDVLTQTYELFGARWTWETGDLDDNTQYYTIKVGYPSQEVSHIFQYGFEGGLLKFEQQVQNAEIANKIFGRGSTENLPYRYFKNVDPNNPTFPADPDWIPELANVYFSELRGKTFRDYVRGWKAKHYGGPTYIPPTDAYRKGYTDEKFYPVEYVEDENSIKQYGEIQKGLDNNEDIKPTIQGVSIEGIGRVDQIVGVEEIVASKDETLNDGSSVKHTPPEYIVSNQDSYTFDITSGGLFIKSKARIKGYEVKVINVTEVTTQLKISGSGGFYDEKVTEGVEKALDFSTNTVTLQDDDTNEVLIVGSQVAENTLVGAKVNITASGFTQEYDNTREDGFDIYYDELHITDRIIYVDVEITLDIEYVGNEEDSTFDIWVKNIWNSERQPAHSGQSKFETDEEYAKRVWGAILGNANKDASKVIFSSGRLSGYSDWEFPIVAYAFDDSKKYNGVKSHWRLTLSKSTAEIESSGKWIPSIETQANVGDYFYFVGIELPHQYVLWAEEKLDEYKRKELSKLSSITPTILVHTDSIRINEKQDDDRQELIKDLRIGNSIKVRDFRFIKSDHKVLRLQSISYSWDANTNIYPNVEIVLSNEVVKASNALKAINATLVSTQKSILLVEKKSIDRLSAVKSSTDQKLLANEFKLSKFETRLTLLESNSSVEEVKLLKEQVNKNTTLLVQLTETNIPTIENKLVAIDTDLTALESRVTNVERRVTIAVVTPQDNSNN